MMTIRTLCIASGCLILSAGCIAQPRLTNRHHSRSFSVEPRPDHYATAGVSVGPVLSAATQPTLLALQLSPPGEAALAAVVGLRSSRLDDIFNALRSPLTKDNSGLPDEIDLTKFEKRLFFAVAKTPNARPGDRIDSILLVLDVDAGDSTRIASISRYETRYETADLGKITGKQTSSQSGTAEVGPFKVGPATLPVKVSGTLQSTQEVGEEVTLRQRYEAFTAQLQRDGKRLAVYEEGALGIDVTGVFTVDVRVSTPRKNGFSILRHGPLLRAACR